MTVWLQSYLFSFLFWSDFALGAIPLLMIYHLTGGRWGGASRGILETFSRSTWIIALFSLPLLLGTHLIYPWANAIAGADPKVLHAHVYLNPAAFRIRTVFYFACWILLSRFTKKLSGGGLVLLSFIASFAAIDWQMSVEPGWPSTIYGLVYMIGQSLSAYSFFLVLFGWICSRRKITFDKKTLRDLGNILLTLVMLWAYLSFMQYLIVWSGNLPHEVTWFKHRTENGWQILILPLALFQFAAPFIILLFRAAKDSPARLAWLGGLVFLARILDHYWTLMPGLDPTHFSIPWQAIVTWIALGALWFLTIQKDLRQEVPSHAG